MISTTDRKTILEQYRELLFDESKSAGGIPGGIFFPENETDLAEVMRESEKARINIRMIGNHTGTTGGSVPQDDEWAVSFQKMNRILQVSQLSDGTLTLKCEPGITIQSISHFLGTPHDWPYRVSGAELLTNNSHFYAPDPTETNAQLGGTIAANASGARSFLYGATRSSVQALSLVTVSGDTFSIERGKIFFPRDGTIIHTDLKRLISIPPFTFQSPLIKNSSGIFSSSPMDLIDLFIGCEGTLAAFSSITVKLHEKADFIAGCSFFTSRDNAFNFADFLRAETHVASIEFFDSSAIEFIDKYRSAGTFSIPEFPLGAACAVMWEFMETEDENFEACADRWETALNKCGSSFSDTWSGVSHGELERLRQFRHALPESVNSLIASFKLNCPSIRKIGTDTALPPDKFRQVYNQYISLIIDSRLAHAAFGHLGDFHIHINLLPQNADELKVALEVYDRIMEITVANGGTVSAEHGIGRLKKKYLLLMSGKDAVNQMKMIKSCFDPQNRLNRGVMFD